MFQAYGGGVDVAASAAESLNWFTQQEFFADDLPSESRRAAGAVAAGSKAHLLALMPVLSEAASADAPELRRAIGRALKELSKKLCRDAELAATPGGTSSHRRESAPAQVPEVVSSPATEAKVLGEESSALPPFNPDPRPPPPPPPQQHSGPFPPSDVSGGI